MKAILHKSRSEALQAAVSPEVLTSMLKCACIEWNREQGREASELAMSRLMYLLTQRTATVPAVTSALLDQ